jgi:hypothetical protein
MTLVALFQVLKGANITFAPDNCPALTTPAGRSCTLLVHRRVRKIRDFVEELQEQNQTLAAPLFDKITAI